MPRVSIGLPVYNGEKYLSEAIDSILSQTFDDFELIISDNASTDRTEEVCRSYQAKDKTIRYYRNEKNIGVAANYKRVFELSNSEYFKWIAHDDLCAPTYLERCVAVLDKEPNIILCFPSITYIDEHGEILRSQQGKLSILESNPAMRVSRLVNYQIAGKDVFWAVYGLIRSRVLQNANLIGKFAAADQILLMELALLGQFRQIPEKLYFGRIHPLSSMRRNRTPQERARLYGSEDKKATKFPCGNLYFKHLACINRARLDFQSTIS